MINQTVSLGTHRLPGRAGILVGVALCLLLFGSPATHADEGGLLEDTAHIVTGATEQAVNPVVQTAESAVAKPVVQAAESPVQQAVEPAVSAVKQTVKPVVEIVEPVAQQTVEPVVQVVKPVNESAPAPVAPQVPTSGGPSGSHPVGVSGQVGAKHVSAGVQGPAAEQRQSETGHRTYMTDLAPKAVGGLGMLRRSGDGDDQMTDQELWTLTNALMHMYAGIDVPGDINAGLSAGMDSERPASVASARPDWTVPLLLGLVLSLLSLAARRRLGRSDRPDETASLMVGGSTRLAVAAEKVSDISVPSR